MELEVGGMGRPPHGEYADYYDGDDGLDDDDNE